MKANILKIETPGRGKAWGSLLATETNKLRHL